jgi:hypothetical protein
MDGHSTELRSTVVWVTLHAAQKAKPPINEANRAGYICLQVKIPLAQAVIGEPVGVPGIAGNLTVGV